MNTDAQLQQDVLAELAWEPAVHAAAIGVEVSDGVVTLSGHVGSFVEKWEAQEAAQRVAGVKALAVEIAVALPGDGRRTDADIARAAKNVLEWSSYWPQERIKVTVEGGWITLSGELDWEYQRAAAATAVRPLMGVVGVIDQIVLAPPADRALRKTGIEAAIQRRIHAGSNQVVVGVSGGAVTLTGTVRSGWERQAARDCAWRAPGVHQVHDRLRIHPSAETPRDSDTAPHLDGEDDTLYQDGLIVGDDGLTLAGTDGDRHLGMRG